jgi:RNA polymerase sigma-70 factor, ECF subfamily
MMPGIVSERDVVQVTALRAARLERGWEPVGLVRRLRVEAAAQDVAMPVHDKPIARRVREWERGQTPPDAKYCGLLTAVYGMSRTELGLPVPRDAKPDLDAERWGRIFAQYNGWLVRRLYAKEGDYALAEDLASETFIRVARSLHKVEPESDGSLHRFIAMHARWVTTDHYSSSRMRHETLKTDEAGEYANGHQDRAAQDDLSMPETLACQLEDFRALVTTLPPVQQRIMALKVLSDLTQQQIAKHLGISPSACSAHVADASAVLRSHLSGQNSELEIAA